MNWKNYWLHFKNTCKHKWWVFYYSWYFGIPIRGFMHDWSKFTPIEFFESARFFKGDSSPINEAKKVQNISFAWQHHKGRNPHHYEYWTDCYDTGTVARLMPYKYVIEMVCDYLAAGRTYNDYRKKEKFTLQKESICCTGSSCSVTTSNFFNITVSNICNIHKALSLV